MDIATISGLVLAITVIITALILDGGSPAELFAAPAAIILIFGGSIGATIITTPLKTALKLPIYIMQAFKTNKFDAKGDIELLTKLADKARREGLLALEDDSKKIKDKFLKRGIMMVLSASFLSACGASNIEVIQLDYIEDQWNVESYSQEGEMIEVQESKEVLAACDGERATE